MLISFRFKVNLLTNRSLREAVWLYSRKSFEPDGYRHYVIAINRDDIEDLRSSSPSGGLSLSPSRFQNYSINFGLKEIHMNMIEYLSTVCNESAGEEPRVG